MIVSLHKIVCDYCDTGTMAYATEKECEDAVLRRGWLRRSVNGGMYHVCPACRRSGKPDDALEARDRARLAGGAL